MSKIKKPLLASALTVAAAAAILVFPVPYSRQRGFDVTFTGSDGRVAHVHLPGHDRAKAEARAAQLAHGASFTVEARRERVWGSVYAMAEEKLFHLDVDLHGKSNAQIEDEIKTQLASQGWDIETIDVKHNDEGGAQFSVTARAGDEQRRLEIRSEGDKAVHVEGFDTRREPGMTDEQLRQKILEQMKARGLEGDVTVEDGRVRVRGEKRDGK